MTAVCVGSAAAGGRRGGAPRGAPGACVPDHSTGPSGRHCAARGTDRFAPPTRWAGGLHGVPLLEGCPARLVCSRRDVIRTGDHHLVVAAVEHAERGEPGDGLVHLSGGLHAVGPTAPARP
ncbi:MULTISPECIES: flavin reductase family protein [Streptomyces]|uniref:flavin reductase family protein n=1 Tax=Streptomyces TaxID=1883 RepID=UPI00345C3563